ncbi:MAG: asparagine synthase-related protein [Candidatus Methanoperedens sp.]|nr:asparagine synthase-related protein [Candidatus Methanoperedens sp.]
MKVFILQVIKDWFLNNGEAISIIMCGIAGAAGKDSEALVKKMLEAIKHRGPDGSGIFSIGDITLGNVLLRITGERHQPIHNNGALTYNGEIYNFREIAERLRITTDSDSEALFALIGSKGIEAAIQELDGDYAFAYTKDEILYLARDPAGVKPLYYNTGAGFAFASEKKALYAIGIREIRTLKPGYMLIYSAGKRAEKKVTGFAVGERITDENTASKMLYNAIEKAVKKRRYTPCAIAFSGGLDSSIIAALCPEAELYSVGMAGSHDIMQTKKAAQLLGMEDKLHLHELTIDDVESALPDVIKATESSDPLKVSIAMPLFFASRDAHNEGIRVMLSGQGADELFAGYKRYESMKPDELELALRKDLDNIAENNLERDDAVTMANAVELRVPYLDRWVVELSLRIAPELKVLNGIRKYILRQAARDIMPHELVFKEKKAAQYSSGIYSALGKLARKNGYRGERAVGRYLEKF